RWIPGASAGFDPRALPRRARGDGGAAPRPRRRWPGTDRAAPAARDADAGAGPPDLRRRARRSPSCPHPRASEGGLASMVRLLDLTEAPACIRALPKED